MNSTLRGKTILLAVESNVERFGGIDAVVANAGIANIGTVNIDGVIRRATGRGALVEQLEPDVRAAGRSFGRHGVG